MCLFGYGFALEGAGLRIQRKLPCREDKGPPGYDPLTVGTDRRGCIICRDDVTHWLSNLVNLFLMIF